MGQVRLLENKENNRIRLLHRQEKTLKIRANHICERHFPEPSGRHLNAYAVIQSCTCGDP